jgi:ABC-type transport system involved in multi-copper enzyme maturation permease subunit
MPLMRHLPAAVYTIRCLVRDTFLQSLHSRTFWLVLGMSVLCILLCLSVRVEGTTAYRVPGEAEWYGSDDQPYTGRNPGQGYMTLAFGSIRLSLFRDGAAQVNFLQVLLAKWGAGTVGILLAVLWSAGFLPDFFRAEAASVLVAKPVPRWALFAGKFLGVLAFVAFQAAVFIGGTWAALGLKTGYWAPGYLLSLPLLLLQFVIIFSFSALLAVRWRNTVVCVIGSVLLWGVCSAVNLTRHAVVAQPALSPEAAPYSPGSQWAAQTCYWVLPKPADLGFLLDEALESGRHFQPARELEAARGRNAFYPELSLYTSLLFTLGLVGFAARRFTLTDY